MSTSVSKSSILIAFLCLLLLLSSINGVQIMDENDCTADYPSLMFKGACFTAGSCDKLCKGAEGALEGLCIGFTCMCKFSCTRFLEHPSGTFKGPCMEHPSGSVACSRTCRAKENSFTGHCDHWKCLCSYNK